MKLRLNGLDVCCVIGERPEERLSAQHLSLDIEMEITSRAATTDSLADTVDYAALADAVRNALVSARCQMIERAAKIAHDVCLGWKTGNGESGVSSVRVAVTKYGAIPSLASATAIYE